MKTAIATDNHKFEDLPREYRKLCMVYLPRPIHNATEYKAAEAIADAMAGREEKMTRDQLDYFEVITSFMTDYDDETRPVVSEVTGLDALRHLVEENSLSGPEVGKILGVDRTLVSKLLRGERNITANHARKLGEHFKLDPSVFL